MRVYSTTFKKKKKTVTPPPPILAKTEWWAEISHLTGCNKASQNSSCIFLRKLNSNQIVIPFQWQQASSSLKMSVKDNWGASTSIPTNTNKMPHPVPGGWYKKRPRKESGLWLPSKTQLFLHYGICEAMWRTVEIHSLLPPARNISIEAT